MKHAAFRVEVTAQDKYAYVRSTIIELVVTPINKLIRSH